MKKRLNLLSLKVVSIVKAFLNSFNYFEHVKRVNRQSRDEFLTFRRQYFVRHHGGEVCLVLLSPILCFIG